MFERVLSLFKPKVVYKIVELPQARTQSGWSEELRASVKTLAHHPGFLAVIDKLRVQRATLQSQLTSSFHKDLRQVDYLQAGIFWLSWVEKVVNQTTQSGSQGYIDPEAEEAAAIKAINDQIEKIGSPNQF